MESIPENKDDIKKILCKQLALLAENSEKADATELPALNHELISTSHLLLSAYFT